VTRPRIHIDLPLASGQQLELPDAAFRHLVQALRLSAGAALLVFDGRGGEYEAVLSSVERRTARIEIGSFLKTDRESPLHLVLVQGISKGERMDWTVQKAAEIGAAEIVPVVTEFCNVAVSAERWDKKLEHWRGILVSACEQNGRNRVPQLHPVQRLDQWLARPRAGTTLMLDPDAEHSLGRFAAEKPPLHLLVGPEGGFSDAEVRAAAAAGALRARLGPRIFRTETAGVVAMGVLQALAGDLA
jgi:16S rRNA (uracil1498-N3)-methyltransferase